METCRCSEDNACAWTEDGTVLCWGDNGYGAVSGEGIGYAFAVPWVVEGVGPVQSVSSRVTRTCALAPDHRVWCWGRHPISNQTEKVPTMVEGISTATVLAITDGVTCFIDDLGRVMTWGHDGDLVLGREGPGTPPAPVEFLDLPQ